MEFWLAQVVEHNYSSLDLSILDDLEKHADLTMFFNSVKVNGYFVKLNYTTSITDETRITHKFFHEKR